jgi:hypothetical protein
MYCQLKGAFNAGMNPAQLLYAAAIEKVPRLGLCLAASGASGAHMYTYALSTED